MRDPYSVLGLTPNASEDELKESYRRLHAEYSEGRFSPGEAGDRAAKNLFELEQAWTDISEKLAAKQSTGGSDALSYVDMLIKEGKYDEAQRKLDSVFERSAEWHYLQSIIYYKRDWLSECKMQLETAVSLEPGNPRYRSALDKLNLVIGNPNTNADALNDGVKGQQHYEQQQGQQRGTGDALSNCCLVYCLTSLCCDCMRCCM